MTIQPNSISHSDTELEVELVNLLERVRYNQTPIRGWEIQAFVAKCLSEGFARGYIQKEEEK